MRVMIGHQPDCFPRARSIQYAVFAATMMLTSFGCGTGTTPASSSAIAQQPSQPSQPNAPAIPTGWVNVAEKYFSFSYPMGWQLSGSPSATKPIVLAAEPGDQHQVFVQFELGFVNQPGIVDKCAGVDKYLTDFYASYFAPLATSTAHYPYTTTTYDGPKDGAQGRSIRVSVTTTSQSGSPGTMDYWLEAVQRTDGIYLIIYKDPSDPYDTWLSFRNTFIGTIDFLSKPLPSSAPCNYF